MAILPGTAITPAGGGYTIDQSLRFNDDDSAYLSRTPASAGNRKTWTWSGWVKRGNITGGMALLGARTDANNRVMLYFGTTGGSDLSLYIKIAGATSELNTNQVFRDSSAWYHVLITVDTAQPTASNRTKMYVNGEQVTSLATSTYPALSGNTAINYTTPTYLGINDSGSGSYFDGYLADVHFIDGQALDPSYFGEADEDYGHWKPIAYTGSYGTNGFYLDFSNASSPGEDQSGNGNDWTANNLASTDYVLDSPTNNFATLNPLKNYANTLSNGNLDFVASNSTTSIIFTTIGITSGKYYWECTQTAFSTNSGLMIGVAKDNVLMTTYFGGDANGWSYWGHDGTKYNNASSSAYGDTFGNNDVIGIAFDADAGTLTFYKNNVSQGTAFTGLTSGPYFPAFGDGFSTGGITASINFGQDSSFAGNKTAQNNTDANGVGDFYYAPPTGFLALCTANLSDPAVVPGENFNTVLYTGTGSAQTISGVGFQPDFIWLKDRSTSNFAHYLTDAIRGFDKYLFSNLTNAEGTNATRVTSVNSDGFAIGNDGAINTNTSAHVAWNWKANNTSGSSNTDGSITSTVAANVDAGFSIVSYTGDGAATATVGHGLSVAPSMVIIKNRDSGTASWPVYHEAIASSYLTLNSTGAGTSGQWISADTDTINFSTLSSWTNTSTNDYIAYAFHSVEGYSKFGSYTGNGSSDGPFVYTGFKPAFVMIKRTDSTDSWGMFDGERDIDNAVDALLRAEGSNAEASMTSLVSNPFADFLSNGFKIRNTSTIDNTSGGTYIYMAFAETDFKFSNAR
jgi:hypothetical protein